MAIVAFLSLLIGGALGLLGGGGSVLTVPMLLWVAGLHERTAIFTSLMVVGVTSAVAATRHAKAGNVDTRTAAVFAVPAMLGAFAGGRAASLVPSHVLLAGFSILMLGSAFGMWRKRVENAGSKTLRPLPTMLLGLAVGFIAGLVGAGGGFMIVPALTLVGGLDMRRAVGTSLVIIALQSAAGVAGQLGGASTLELDWGLNAVVVAMSVAGSWLGVGLGQHVQPDKLRRAFAVLVAAVAVFMLQGA